MANYYTYGMVPDVDETVYGTSVNYAGLGFPEYADRGLPEEEPVGPSPLSLAEDEPVPADRSLPEEPYYGPSEEYNEPVTMPTRREAVPNLFVEGADVPQSSGLDPDAMARVFAMLGPTSQGLEPIAYGRGFSLGNLEGGLPITEARNVRVTPEVKQTLADLGLTEAQAAEIASRYKADQAAAAPLTQMSMAEVARQAGVSEADLAKSQEQIGGVFGAREKILQDISNRLKSNDFKGAFDVAVAAENAGEGQFFENIVNPELMRYMRGPMTRDEIKQFYAAIPQDEYIKRYGEGNMFLMQMGLDKSLEALQGDEKGYVDPRAALMARPDPTIGIIGDIIAAAAAATGIGIPAAMAISGAQKYVTSGGDIKAALVSAALTGAGMKVGEALKAPGLADLTEVTTTSSKAAVAAANAADAAIKAGVAPGALAEVVVTAAKQAAPSLAQGVINSVTGAVINQLAAQGVDIPQDQLQQAQQATQRGPLEQANATAAVDPGLEEVVVQSLRKGTPIDVNTLLASTGAQATQDILSERQIAEQKELEAREAQQQPQEGPLEEVVVEGSRPTDFDVVIPSFTFPGKTPVDVTQPDYIEDLTFPEGPIEEIVVEGKRPADLDLVAPAFTIPGKSPIDLAQPDYIEDLTFPEGPIEEVVVEGKRPTDLDLVAPPFTMPGKTPVDLPQPDVVDGRIVYPEQDLDEVIIEGSKPTDGGLNLPPFKIPLKTPVEGIKEPDISKPDPLKELMDKYGSLENLLKLIGAIGSAASGTKKPTTPTAPGTGGMGGALPKYTYTRQQLSPDIDYYTYGTRPEAKFFDYGVQLEKPVQPALPQPQLPPARPPGDEPVMAQGGLMGYSKGGSKESRYFDGPGSGRDDKIPALLSDGEYVMDAETLALLGDGSTKEGARRMDQFRAKIRQHKGRALSRGQISPDAKSPDKYMGGGLA